jgi:hypothetical protein
MARGGTGAFGGKQINSYPVWLGFCAVFLLGLVDWRRLLSLRNLDLLALLSFSIALWFFNRGDIFTAMPLVYPGLLWLLARSLWVGRTDRPSRGTVVWPVWLLAAATVFLAGFRVTLNVQASNVIDVGYAGVIGADRIWRGQSPYGNFPVEDGRPKCGPADSSGEVRDRVQTNGRCENANPNGDTYGPFSYIAYLPGYLVFGWTGQWDKLPAAHATTILWDLLALVGLALVGRRLGGPKDGPRLAAILAFAWVAWPFTQYASSSNTNDLIQPALLIWGFWFASSPALRGGFLALGSWVKFAPLLLVPLWSGFPGTPRLRRRLVFFAGFVVATALSFSVLLLDWPIWHTARVFWDRTIPTQVGRQSPFSLWDWRQYHAKGIPNLHAVQIALEVLLVLGSLALWRWPRRRSPLRLAALTAAVLIGFELVLTHWFFLYLPWFFPFVAIALLSERPSPEPVPEPADEHAEPVLVAG